MPKVSVITPTYNRESCVTRALRSVQNQTLQDFEILICDDASTDSTRDIVRTHQESDDRIRLLCLSENLGPGAARNLGMRAAQGKYISFLDSDDEWLPDKLARQVETMDSAPPEIRVCFCGAKIIKNGNISKTVICLPDKAWERDTFRKYVMERIEVITSTVLFRRTCLAKSGLMVPEMRVNEDAEFILRLFLHFGLAVIPEPLAVYHLVVSPNSRQVYGLMQTALPYQLRHFEQIRQQAGYWAAVTHRSTRHRNMLTAAIRERRWHEAGRDLWQRLRVFPMLWPSELMLIIKAFLSGRFRS